MIRRPPRSKRTDTLFPSTTPFRSVVLIAWGLHKLNYPWLRPVEWFAPLGFLLADFLAMLAAAGLLLVTAGRLRSIADQAEQRHVQSREHLATLNQLLQVSLGGKSLSGQQIGRAHV